MYKLILQVIPIVAFACIQRHSKIIQSFFFFGSMLSISVSSLCIHFKNHIYRYQIDHFRWNIIIESCYLKCTHIKNIDIQIKVKSFKALWFCVYMRRKEREKNTNLYLRTGEIELGVWGERQGRAIQIYNRVMIIKREEIWENSNSQSKEREKESHFWVLHFIFSLLHLPTSHSYKHASLSSSIFSYLFPLLHPIFAFSLTPIFSRFHLYYFLLVT